MRRAVLREIIGKLSEFEKKYGKFEDFSKRVLSGEVDLWEEYAEWLELLHAYHDYEETGSIEYYFEEEVSEKIVRRLLSRKMMQLMNEISLNPQSISSLAKRLNRSIPNVYKDLMFLYKNRLIDFWKHGRKLIPYLLLQKITIQL